MVIKGINKSYIAKIYGQKMVKEKNAADGYTVADGDRVDISSAAKEMQKLVQDTLSVDDVRMEKVEDLKGQINAGRYHVPAEKLADALLRYIDWLR